MAHVNGHMGRIRRLCACLWEVVEIALIDVLRAILIVGGGSWAECRQSLSSSVHCLLSAS